MSQKFMDVSRETPDVTTKPTCYDAANILSEGGMIRLETLIELKLVNSSCSSLLVS